MPEKSINTKQQLRAQRAYRKVHSHINRSGKEKDAYTQLSKRFPALVHSSGLAQAVAFVKAKGKENAIIRTYLEDLQHVMEVNGDLTVQSREEPLTEYQNLSRKALESATWIKRCAESMLEVKKTDGPGMQG
jgi:CRISPR-associated protein Cmr5